MLGHRLRAAGFTLIEMMASLALGSLLIITITQTFRAVVRVVSIVTQQGRENELMQAGLLAVIEDADFYHSEANPDPPYAKGWTRAPLTAADPTDRRHFAAVVFDARTAPVDPYRDPAPPARLALRVAGQPESAANPPVVPNPNVLLPSDPRSWVRVTTVNNSRWETFSPQGRRARYTPLGNARTDQVRGAGHLAAATDMRSLPEGPGVGVGQPVDPRINQALPAMQAALWQRLAYLGVYAYTRPGAPINCLDSTGFLPRWHAPDTASGQGVSSPLPPFYPATTPDSDYLAQGSAGEQHRIQNVGARNSWETHTSVFFDYQRLGFIRMKPVYPADVNVAGIDLARSIRASTGAADYRSVMNLRPWEGGGGGSGSYNYTTFLGSRVDFARDPALTSTTYRMPSNRSDAERPSVADTGTAPIAAQPIDLEARPEGYPVLSTSILRMHAFLADQATVCRVQVRVPETGRLLELPLTLQSTTYRGARQHWAGVVSASLATPAGDSYAIPQP